jgi:hypothetical protein
MATFRHRAAAALLCAAAALPVARAAQPQHSPPPQPTPPLPSYQWMQLEWQVPSTPPPPNWQYQIPPEGPPQLPQDPPHFLEYPPQDYQRVPYDGPPQHSNTLPPVVPPDLDAGMTTVTYSVADLVVPVDGTARGGKTLDEALIRLILQHVAPESWRDQGGRGTIQYYPLGLALVVTQSAANQRRVAELLESLRKLQDVEVAVEIRMVTVSPEVAKAFKSLAGFQTQHASDPRRAIEAAFLNDEQRLSWFQLFQCDRATNVMQAPKLTLFNAQNACLQIGDDCMATCNPLAMGSGLRANVLPVISADRRSVRLHLDVAVADAGCKLTLDKVVNVSSGSTIVCSLGRTTVQTTMPVTVPTSCWTNTGTETWNMPSREEREVFLLVTPRVVVTPHQEEQELFQFYTGQFIY